MAKIWNAKKDGEEIIHGPGLHIGPEQREAREVARIEFREGVEAETHMIIGTVFHIEILPNFSQFLVMAL